MRKKITLVASLAFAAALCAGFGATNMQAEAQVDWADFKITETAVRLGTGTQEDPTGLRFKVNCPDVALGETAEYYTMISFTSSVKTDENTAGTPIEYNLKVPATKWRTDNSGWNAVLLEIPASDYVTEITAQSFVAVNGEVAHTSNSVTSSIAKTASKVLNGGMVDAKLDAFVANAVSAVSFGENDGQSIEAEVGEVVELEATTTPEGYGVVWSSSDASVATVDNNGKVTVVGAGKAKINATMGQGNAVCEIVSTWGEAYGFENGSTISPLNNFRILKGSDGVIKTLANGNNVLDVTAGLASVDLEGNPINAPTPDFAFDTAYFDWAFENHDYLTFSIYSDVPYMRYMYDNALGDAGYQQMYGYTGVQMYYANGIEIEDGLYEYKLSYNKTLYNRVKALGDGYVHSIRFAFTDDIVTEAQNLVSASFVYFDDICVGDYTTDAITFADGKANGAIQGGTTISKYANLAQYGDDYAMLIAGPNTAGNGIAVQIDPTYLHYIFNEQGATALQFKTYTLDRNATGINWSCFFANNVAKYVGAQSYQQYVADGGYFLTTFPRDFYHTYFNTDGSYKSGSIGGEAALDVFGFLMWHKNGGSYVQGAYLDEITPIFPVRPTNTIDFENDVNGFIGVDSNALWTQDGIVTHEGDKALKFTMNSSSGGFSLSHEYMRWAFYEQGATSITFTVSADTDITLVSRMHEATIAWYGAQGKFDIWQWTPCTNEIVDGNVKVTLTADQYKATFAEDGTHLRNAGGAVAGTPYYFGIRVTLSGANGGFGPGTAIYLDDFQVNYAE